MVAPSLVLDELLDVCFRADVGARPGLGEGAIERDQFVESSASKLHRFVDRLQVFLVCAVGGQARVERVHRDLGHLLRVFADQRDSAGVVARASFEDDPDPVASIFQGVVRIAWEVAFEVRWRARDEEVWVVGGIGLACSGGPLRGSNGNTVGGIDAFTNDCKALLPLLQARVWGCVAECAILGDGEISRRFADDTDFVTVLEVGANTREVFHNLDIESFKFFLGPDTAELQELRRLECACGDDDFFLHVDRPLSPLRTTVAGISGVKTLALDELDASGTRPAA